MKKIVLITNRNYTVLKFRKYLIESLLKKDYDVSLIIIDDTNDKIKIDNVSIYYINGSNRSINYFKKNKIKNRIKKILRIVNPDIVFTFQLTPNLFGTFAAKECNVKKIFSMVEGLGDVYIYKTLEWSIIRYITNILYRRAFKRVDKVFFINNDDKNTFIEKRIINEEKCVVIPGIGVDIDYFKEKPIINNSVFIMIARMSETKGIFEYCKAATIIKKKYPNTVFNYLGSEFTIEKKDIQKYIDSGAINYLGYKDDIRKELEECSVNILPSYREGFGLVIAEAAAVGRPSIASNVVGCKDALKEGVSGLLFENKNVNDLVDKIEYFINNSEEIRKMGREARKNAEIMFNKDIINKKIINEIENSEKD